MGNNISKKQKNDDELINSNQALQVPTPPEQEVNYNDPSPIHAKTPIESILKPVENRRSSNSSTGTSGNFSEQEELTPYSIPIVKDVNIDNIIQQLLDIGQSGKASKSLSIKTSEINSICTAVREIFLSQPTLIEIASPVKVVGDVHGQFSDLLRLFDMCGYPPSSNFLFLGDYVDRGKQSLETILLLFCYKIKYPENFFLLRGNHECASITRVYGFYDECKRRSNVKVWKTFINVFNCLPVAAIIASKIFCVHGGLSPSLNNMDDIRKIERPCDVPDYGLLNDLLWSDPGEKTIEWEDSERGVSYCFGKIIVTNFLSKFQFDLVCRAHMVVEDGYEFFSGRGLVTIFSAPNYCGEFDNYGAIMNVNSDLLCSFELLKPLNVDFLRTKKKRTSPPLINHFSDL